MDADSQVIPIGTLLNDFYFEQFGVANPAALVSFTYDAGQVVYIDPFPLPSVFADVQNFVLGEQVWTTVTIDDQTPDSESDPLRGVFQSESATIVL